MDELGFSSCKADPYVWMIISKRADGRRYYQYVLLYTDDPLVFRKRIRIPVVYPSICVLWQTWYRNRKYSLAFYTFAFCRSLYIVATDGCQHYADKAGGKRVPTTGIIFGPPWTSSFGAEFIAKDML